MQQAADAEHRAKLTQEERGETTVLLQQQLAQAEHRAKSAEKERDDARRQAEAAKRERNDLLADDRMVYDEGTEIHQNIWEQRDVSAVLQFPTSKSVVCGSVDQQGGNDMPGVHSLGAIDNGRTTQSVWMKGSGYTLFGLVTCEEEKRALRHHAGADWTKLPFMTPTYNTDGDERAGDIFTIEVDMIERNAKLYISDSQSSRLLEPHTVWEHLPDKVWIAIAFKRNSGREAVLMPCIHWNLRC